MGIGRALRRGGAGGRGGGGGEGRAGAGEEGRAGAGEEGRAGGEGRAGVTHALISGYGQPVSEPRCSFAAAAAAAAAPPARTVYQNQRTHD